jgi:hypothetical protein
VRLDSGRPGLLKTAEIGGLGHFMDYPWTWQKTNLPSLT